MTVAGISYNLLAEAKGESGVKDLKLRYAIKKERMEGKSLDILDTKAVLKNYYPHFSWMDICADKFFLPMFEAFDKDGDGKLSDADLSKLVLHLNGRKKSKAYTIVAGPDMEYMAKRLVAEDPERFVYFPTKWKKFPDGSDNIEVGGFTPTNRISDKHVLFLASFSNNDKTLSQYHVLTMLSESFPKDLTILLPFYPTATMERVAKEGVCATANTTARFFSGLPKSGRPARLMVYDLHTLQNRFYLAGSTLASLHTAVPLLLEKIPKTNIDCVAFPDDGAEKRYSGYFKKALPGVDFIVCGKKRDLDDPSKRTIVIKDGNPEGKHVVVIDDMVQSGGTLTECGKVLKAHGAKSVSAFVSHGIFPRNAHKRFAKGGDRAIFDNFWVTNSNPVGIKDIPAGDCFEVLDIAELVVKDL